MKFLLIALFGAGLHAAPKKELSVALNAEYETLNPVVNSMMVAFYIHDTALRPLVALTPDGKARPVLLKELPRLKGKTTQIEILAEAVWGDGTPLTCKDVKATWEIGRHPNVSAPARTEYDNIEDIRISPINPKKCDIVFREPKTDFHLSLPKPMPAHLEMKVFEEHKGKAQAYERNSLYVRDVSNPGLYNGPFRVSEQRLGSHVTLVRNEKYFGKKPFFEKLIFKFILNTSTMEANLRSGNVGMISSAGLTFDQALAFEKKVKVENLPYAVKFVPASIYSKIALNLDHPILGDLRVRKALVHGLNRAEMAKAFFEGRQQAALHFATPLDSWYTESPAELVIYEPNRRKAGKLLDEAGWKLGSNGIRSKDGKSLALTIVGAADHKLNEVLQTYLQESWKKIGVQVSVKNYPARVLFGEILRQRKFEMGLSSAVNSPDPSMRSMLHSQMIPSKDNSFSGMNRPGWKNPQVDQWLDQADAEFDPAKRVALMKKVLKAYTEEVPEIALYYRSNHSVTPKDLKGYRLSGHFYSEYLEIESWTR